MEERQKEVKGFLDNSYWKEMGVLKNDNLLDKSSNFYL
jgi:hypothetical protein